uniref:Cytochrome c oxidase subunit 3 n=1 Tax=Megachile strupigera TaxID=1735309 RepID=A0A0P0IUA5_9HYME|nr:cytochrome c oxidase subunit III [Megachile strupigera]
MPWKKHPFHLVTISPWPLICSLNSFNLMITLIIWFYFKIYWMMMINFTMLMLSMFLWWRDIIRESTYQGQHSQTIKKMLKFSMILFIISELMFFISFFWTYFHMMLSPSIEIGMNWPPKNIIMFNPYKFPLLNSLILISSGMTLTWSHYCLMNKKYFMSKILLFLTIMLGMIFSFIQYIEYYEAPFSINDSTFSSIFFLMTGFHGLHVFIGIIFLLTCFIRMLMNHFSNYHHFNFESSSWYWHFVDVIWLLLYIIIYWWNYNN